MIIPSNDILLPEMNTAINAIWKLFKQNKRELLNEIGIERRDLERFELQLFLKRGLVDLQKLSDGLVAELIEKLPYMAEKAIDLICKFIESEMNASIPC